MFRAGDQFYKLLLSKQNVMSHEIFIEKNFLEISTFSGTFDENSYPLDVV